MENQGLSAFKKPSLSQACALCKESLVHHRQLLQEVIWQTSRIAAVTSCTPDQLKLHLAELGRTFGELFDPPPNQDSSGTHEALLEVWEELWTIRTKIYNTLLRELNRGSFSTIDPHAGVAYKVLSWPIWGLGGWLRLHFSSVGQHRARATRCHHMAKECSSELDQLIKKVQRILRPVKAEPNATLNPTELTPAGAGKTQQISLQAATQGRAPMVTAKRVAVLGATSLLVGLAAGIRDWRFLLSESIKLLKLINELFH